MPATACDAGLTLLTAPPMEAVLWLAVLGAAAAVLPAAAALLGTTATPPVGAAGVGAGAALCTTAGAR